MPHEVVVSNPQINQADYPLARWSYIHRSSTTELLQKSGASPFSHPTVLELFAGDGPVSQILIELGWHPENITCIDCHIPKRPFSELTNWHYWDLYYLTRQISSGKTIDSQILPLKHSFDIVAVMYTPSTNDQLSVLANFFQNSQGIIFGEFTKLQNLSRFPKPSLRTGLQVQPSSA